MTRLEEAAQKRLIERLSVYNDVETKQDSSIAILRNEWELYSVFVSRHRTLEELQLVALVKSLICIGEGHNHLKYISLFECPLHAKATVIEARECADRAAEVVIKKLIDEHDRQPIVWRYCRDMMSATHSLAYYMVAGDSKVVEQCMEPIRDLNQLGPFYPNSDDAMNPEQLLAEALYALYLVDQERCRQVILETVERNRKAIFPRYRHPS